MAYTVAVLPRALTKPLRKAAGQYPVVTVTGPRQSGKTTLVQSAFPRYAYVSLEDPDLRSLALEDPRGFLAQFDGPAILDEVQNVPQLLSYIQTLVDKRSRAGQFILTGSQNLLLLQSVSQSLAGRTAILHLLPLSLSEIHRRAPLSLDVIGRRLPKQDRLLDLDWPEVVWRGFYPSLQSNKVQPQSWLANYYRTYVERDVRSIVNVGDLETFSRFVRICAGRCGQLLNTVSLGNDCGITHTTVRRWLSVLEASFIIQLLRPYHQSFNKRLIKAPKLYFTDTGLLCYLLGIRSSRDLRSHSSRGAVFESFVVAELMKAHWHQGIEPSLWFWRDSGGHELDLILDHHGSNVAIEIKSGETVASDYYDGLKYWQAMAVGISPTALIYGGNRMLRSHGTMTLPWSAL